MICVMTWGYGGLQYVLMGLVLLTSMLVMRYSPHYSFFFILLERLEMRDDDDGNDGGGKEKKSEIHGIITCVCVCMGMGIWMIATAGWLVLYRVPT
ncbi:hypothetical protein F4778DRAFT_738077, partial [Xylariomycetidae sp. FL2044]